MAQGDFDQKRFNAAIGKRIAKVRKSKGYSQDRLALEAGFSRGTMSKVESGKSDPRGSTLFRIAEILDVNPGKLFP